MKLNLVQYDRFQRMMTGARKLTGEGQEGSHTEVFRFDSDAVASALAGLPEKRDPKCDRRFADWLSANMLVKKGKIDYFAQPLLGEKPTRIRRSMVSWVFGPLGFNIEPSLEKTMLDATEAARVIPYLGNGDLGNFFAPDLMDALETGIGEEGPAPNRGDVFVRSVLAGVDLKESVYSILEKDAFFHEPAPDASILTELQRNIRRKPLTPAMENRFAEFFENPITVGVRDTLRWFKGSRHPQMPWEKAKGTLRKVFDRWGQESFILPEITYYTYDTQVPASDLAELFERNMDVAREFAADLEKRIPASSVDSFRRLDPERIAFELLDFHTDYRSYELEPYAGFLSTSAAKAAGRAAIAIMLESADLPVPGQGNLELSRLPRFHTTLVEWFSKVPDADREKLFQELGKALGRYRRRSMRRRSGSNRVFERIPRTFYTFQQRADLPPEGGRFIRLLTMHDLWKSENLHIWDEYPELSEKLAVFFTLVYRHFSDTGFIVDLRPKDSGRDIFIYGLYGTVTENLLLAEVEKDGRKQVRLLFVDNRDQFKDFRGDEDRRYPIGMAKYAMRLIYPIIEPALVRAVGTFVERVRKHDEGEIDRTPKDAFEAIEQSLDIAHKVAKDGVAQAFVSTKAAVDDLIDDAHTGAKRILEKKVKKRLKR